MTRKPVEFVLSEPVTVGKTTYATLTLRKMKAKDMIAGDLVSGNSRKAFAIFASMADVPIQVIEEMDVDDFEGLGEVATPLMGKSAVAARASALAKAAAEASKTSQ